ncbi:hypothetical protein JKP88DRAFT_171943 [Tribonema minus]|uniref:TRP C-terminal domain-containing protein n=1 Tax=Tribonema minus TaxID=303371 RepID=A0A835YJS2_9STRA|nr:hypothetical protein JKP88DRAFT_171943 [Tribonema minus]
MVVYLWPTYNVKCGKGVQQSLCRHHIPSWCLCRRQLRVTGHYLRLPIVVFQLLWGFMEVTGLAYPQVYATMIAYISFASDLTLVLGCVAELNFYQKLLAMTLAPLAVVVLLGASWLLACWRAQQLQRSDGFEAAYLMHQEALRRHWTAFLAFTFLVFGVVSSVVFLTFVCEELDYLRADYSVQCYTSEYWAYAVYAAVMLFVYPIGITALYSVLLWRKSKLKMNNKGNSKIVRVASLAPRSRLVEASGFLWEQYTEETPWWEIAECVRRLLITGFVAFILPGTVSQAVVGMLMAFASLMAYLMVRPHRDRRTYWQYITGALILYLSTMSALLQKLDIAKEPQSQAIVGIVLIVLSVAMIAAAVFQTFAGFTAAVVPKGTEGVTQEHHHHRHTSGCTEAEMDQVSSSVKATIS